MSEDFSHTKGTIAFVLAIMSILSCCGGIIWGPIAVFLANGYSQECIVAGVEPEGLGKLAKTLGIVGTVLALIWSTCFCLSTLLQIAM